MKAAEANKKHAAGEAASVRKVLLSTQEVAKTSWALLSPAVQSAYEGKVKAAEALISKVEAAVAGSCSEEVKTMKLDLSKTSNLLKSQFKAAQKYGIV